MKLQKLTKNKPSTSPKLVKFDPKRNKFNLGVVKVKAPDLPVVKSRMRNQSMSSLIGPNKPSLETGRSGFDTNRSAKSLASSIKVKEDPIKRRQREIIMLHH